MNGIPALDCTQIIPHITPFSSPFDVSDEEAATVFYCSLCRDWCTCTIWVCVLVCALQSVCSSKAAKRLRYLRPIKPGALFIVARRGSAACWGRQNAERVPLNWNHEGAHIFTSAAGLKTMFYQVPWHVCASPPTHTHTPFPPPAEGQLTENLDCALMVWYYKPAVHNPT